MAENQNNSNNQTPNDTVQNNTVNQTTFERIQDLKARRDAIIEQIAAKDPEFGATLKGIKGKDNASNKDIGKVKSGINSKGAEDADVKTLLEELLKLLEELKELVKKHFHENLGSLTSALGLNKNKALGDLNTTFQKLAENIDENTAVKCFALETMTNNLNNIKGNMDLGAIKGTITKVMTENDKLKEECRKYGNKNFYQRFYDKMRTLGKNAKQDVEQTIELLLPDGVSLASVLKQDAPVSALDEKTQQLIKAYNAFFNDEKEGKTFRNYENLANALMNVKSKSNVVSQKVDCTLESMSKARQIIWYAEMTANRNVAQAQRKVNIKESEVSKCEKTLDELKKEIVKLENNIIDLETNADTNKENIDKLLEELEQKKSLKHDTEKRFKQTTNEYEMALRELAVAQAELNAAGLQAKSFRSDNVPDQFLQDFAVKSQLISYGSDNEYIIAYRGQLINAKIAFDEETKKHIIHISDCDKHYEDFIENGVLKSDKANMGYTLVKEPHKNAAETLLSKTAEKNGEVYVPSKDIQDRIENMADNTNMTAAKHLIRCFNDPQLSPDEKFSVLSQENNGKIEYSVKNMFSENNETLRITLSEKENGEQSISIRLDSHNKNGSLTSSNFGQWTQNEEGIHVKYNLTSQNEAALYMVRLPVVQEYLETLGITKEMQEKSLLSKVARPFVKVEGQAKEKMAALYEHIEDQIKKENKNMSVRMDAENGTISVFKGKMAFDISFDPSGNPFTTHCRTDYRNADLPPILVSHRGISTECGIGISDMFKLSQNADFRDTNEFLDHCIESVADPYKTPETLQKIVDVVQNTKWDMETLDSAIEYRKASVEFERSKIDRGLENITLSEISSANAIMKAVEKLREIETTKELSRMPVKEQEVMIGRAVIETYYSNKIAQYTDLQQPTANYKSVLRNTMDSNANNETVCRQVAQNCKAMLSDIRLFDQKKNKLVSDEDMRKILVDYAVDSYQREMAIESKSFQEAIFESDISANSLGYLADAYSVSFNDDLSSQITDKITKQYADVNSKPLQIAETWQEHFDFTASSFTGLTGQDRQRFKRDYERAVNAIMSRAIEQSQLPENERNDTVTMSDILTSGEGHSYQIMQMLQNANVISEGPIKQGAEFKINIAKAAEYDARKNEIMQSIDNYEKESNSKSQNAKPHSEQHDL